MEFVKLVFATLFLWFSIVALIAFSFYAFCSDEIYLHIKKKSNKFYK